jgi:ribosomal subunit interface protein
MQISVSGKHLDIGSALQEYVEAELQGAVKKYFDRAISADVVFTKVRHLFVADILVNEGTGTNTLIKSRAEDDDVYASFDIACAKVEKQLRRYKRRIKDHHKDNKHPFEAIEATKYVLSPNADDAHKNEHDSPLIIAEKQTQIETLTVSDAVMRMDLGQLPAVMFKNKKTGAINVIYRREDGNISWIDSGSVKAA